MSQSTICQSRCKPTLPEFNQYCRELMCLARQGHSMVMPVGEYLYNDFHVFLKQQQVFIELLK